MVVWGVEVQLGLGVAVAISEVLVLGGFSLVTVLLALALGVLTYSLAAWVTRREPLWPQLAVKSLRHPDYLPARRRVEDRPRKPAVSIP